MTDERFDDERHGTDPQERQPYGDGRPAGDPWADPWAPPPPGAAAPGRPLLPYPPVDAAAPGGTPPPAGSTPPWWMTAWDTPGGSPQGTETRVLPAGPAGPGGPGSGGGPDFGSGPRRPRRPLAIGAAVALAAALIGGGIGGAIGAHTASVSTSSAPGTPPLTTAPVIARGSTSETTVEAVAAALTPSVVSIDETGPQISGTGSGVIIRSDGYILTNNHVVSGAAGGGSLTVTLSDGRQASATIVGRDPSSDLAVIKVSGLGPLPAARIGDSHQLKVGETVLAFGSPLGLQGTVTEGIVSSLNRPVHTGDPSVSDTNAVIDAIQTDAAINPGNSGGPLVNSAGQVIGIDSAIATLGSSGGGFSQQQSGSIGLGFAIPIDSAMRTANQLIATGHATHAILGISAGTTQNMTGALVRSVQPGSAAAAAGLQPGDVITSFGGRRVIDADTLVVAVRSHNPGDHVALTYQRAGSSRTVTVTLGSVTD